MTLERIQFIGVLVWMIGMLVLVFWSMRDLIRAENADHERRQGHDASESTGSNESKSGPSTS